MFEVQLTRSIEKGKELHSCKKFIATKKFLSKVNGGTCRSCMEIKAKFLNEE